jgi:hypothetical protein
MAREFNEHALDGHNYPTWALDIKIRLVFCGMAALTPPAERERQHFWIPSSTRHYSSSATISTRFKVRIYDGGGAS